MPVVKLPLNLTFPGGVRLERGWVGNVSDEVADLLKECGAYIPADPQDVPDEVVAITAPKAGKLVNLNTATAEELNVLPEVGPATVNRIINGRPYASLDSAKAGSKMPDAAWTLIADLVEI